MGLSRSLKDTYHLANPSMESNPVNVEAVVAFLRFLSADVADWWPEAQRANLTYRYS